MRLSLTRKPHKKAVTQLMTDLGQSVSKVIPENQPQPARQRNLISARRSMVFASKSSKNKGSNLVTDSLTLLPRQSAPRS